MRGQVFILSAKHGVVSPDEEIDAYDLSLGVASREYRVEWASRVSAQLRLLSDSRLVVLAGDKYCRGWTPDFANIERPLRGLGIGQQLAWLTRALAR